MKWPRRQSYNTLTTRPSARYRCGGWNTGARLPAPA